MYLSIMLGTGQNDIWQSCRVETTSKNPSLMACVLALLYEMGFELALQVDCATLSVHFIFQEGCPKGGTHHEASLWQRLWITTSKPWLLFHLVVETNCDPPSSLFRNMTVLTVFKSIIFCISSTWWGLLSIVKNAGLRRCTRLELYLVSAFKWLVRLCDWYSKIRLASSVKRGCAVCMCNDVLQAWFLVLSRGYKGLLSQQQRMSVPNVGHN